MYAYATPVAVRRRRTRRAGYRGVGQLGQPAQAGQDSIMNALAQAGARQVKQVVFRSQISPEIALDPNQSSPRTADQGGASEAFLRFVRPALYLNTAGGVVKVAPWGEPKGNYFPLLLGGALLVGALTLGLVVRGLRR